MDAFEGKLAEQVRLYKDLYDPSMRDHRDSQIILREIATTMAKFYVFLSEGLGEYLLTSCLFTECLLLYAPWRFREY